jgi:hypothetical protein
MKEGFATLSTTRISAMALVDEVAIGGAGTHSRPVLGSVKNTNNFDRIIIDAVDDQPRCEYEFTCCGIAAGSAAAWKPHERLSSLKYSKRDGACSLSAIVLFDVVANRGEIADSGLGPADTHHPP